MASTSQCRQRPSARPCLKAEEGGEVRRLGRVILGELLALAARALRALLGQETQVTEAGICSGAAVGGEDVVSEERVRSA